MPARILDGKSLARKIRDALSVEVARLEQARGIGPGLTVVLIGENPASQVYVRNKENAARAIGMNSRVLRLDARVSQTELLDVLGELNVDPEVHGILVQLPLPKQIEEAAVLEAIEPRKDVDGFHPENVGLLTIGRPRFVPCTALAVQTMLEVYQVETKGANVVVLGRSNIVGKPTALLLMQKGAAGDATVTVVHTASRDVAGLCREADILIAAAGRPELVRGDWIKPGAVVIDVGIHKRDDGSLCGDVAFDEAVRLASLITPVPGGVGPMTVAMLLRNTLQAAEMDES